MREAIALARRGLGQVSPNPLVGAVVARGNRVLGIGWHAKFGDDHAEVVALRNAGAAAQGATLYITLEPCSHDGKTPPCTEEILRSGVGRVVIACRDPNPEARGGADILREAGVRIEIGTEGAAAKRLNAPFLWYHSQGVPFVSLKLALSLDAKLGAASVRTPVTGMRALEHVHHLRAAHEGILIGRRTADIDDPLLTVRGELVSRVPPVRVVLDTTLGLNPDSQLVRTISQAPVCVLADPECEGFAERAAVLAARGVEIVEVPRNGDNLCLATAWKKLATRGLASLLVEGGGQVASSVLAGGHVQRIHAFLAPVFYGEHGVPAFVGLPASNPGDWRAVERESLGQDTRLLLEHKQLDSVLRAL